MSDFVRRPLEKLLNRNNIMSRISKLETRAVTATPTQTVEDLTDMSETAAALFHEGTRFYVVNNEGDKIYLNLEGVTPRDHVTPMSTECWNTSDGSTPYTVAAIAGGTIANVTSEADHPGIISFANNTTANAGGIAYAGSATAYTLRGGEVFEAIFYPLSFATQSNYRFGFFDSLTSSTEVDAVAINLVGGGVSLLTATPEIVSASGLGSYTVIYAGSGVIVNEWGRVRIVVNGDATQADVYVYGTYPAPPVPAGERLDALRYHARCTAGLPSNRQLTFGVKAWRTNNTNTTLLYVDKVDFYSTATLSR
jgi:hypothetical protein